MSRRLTQEQLVNKCSDVSRAARSVSCEQISLFCQILGYPDNLYNGVISDDPHGTADLQEGYRVINMTHIDTFLSAYPHWLQIYGDNSTLRKVVDEWYYWTTEIGHDGDQERNVSLQSWLMGWRPNIKKGE